jgi:hypothetical protein
MVEVFSTSSLDRFIQNKIFLCLKQSRLEVKKTLVRFSNGQNKMAAKAFENWTNSSGFRMVEVFFLSSSLDHFINKRVTTNILFMTKQSRPVDHSKTGKIF